MKNIHFTLIALICYLGVSAQIVNIPDANFKAKLLEANTNNTIAKDLDGNYFKIDANNDSEIQLAEAGQVSYLDVQRDFSIPDSPVIISLEGILNFVNLKELNCSNQQLTSLNLNNMIKLVTLNCSSNQLSSINLNGLKNLESFNSGGTGNQFGGFLDVSGLSKLRILNVSANGLAGLNINGLKKIENLSCGFNNLTALDVSSLKQLKSLICFGNSVLASIDVTGLSKLEELVCSNNVSLVELICSKNKLTQLDLTNLPNLSTLEVTKNPITILDLNSLTALQNLNCSKNQLTSLYLKNGVTEDNLDFSGNQNLTYVCVDPEQISTVQSLVTSYGYRNATVDSNCNNTSVAKKANTTTTLEKTDLAFSDYCRIYPNPVKDVLNITKAGVDLNSITIFNDLGQVVTVIPDAHNVSRIDVSHLGAGIYFLKINSNKGISTTRFIKK